MTHGPLSRLFTGTAMALALAAPLIQPAQAQQTSDRLTVREAPAENQAADSELQQRLSVEIATMRDHAEAIQRGQRDLERCAAEADLAGPDASVPDMLDCFVAQAIDNERTLMTWSGSLGEVTGILAESAAAYAGLAEAEADKVAAIEAQREALLGEREALGRRIKRVQAFLAANNDDIEGEALYEAHGLMLSWSQLEATEAHHASMVASHENHRQLMEDISRKLSGTSREASLLRQEFADRATREGFYVAEVAQAARLDVALEQASGMMVGMARMGDRLHGVRTALDRASAERPRPAASSQPVPVPSLLGGSDSRETLLEFFRTVDTGAAN